MASRKLLLFDIDGTLLDTAGAGLKAINAAMRRTFPEAAATAEMPLIELAGATDSGILKLLFGHFGIPETPGNVARFYDNYLDELGRNLADSESLGRLLPGIQRLLDAIRRDTLHITALLTGNIQRGAFMKVAHFGIDSHFKFGAFGDDHHDRNCLGPVALRRAMDHYGFSFEPKDVVVIGDTPRDIHCAKAIKARTLIVATGTFTSKELLAHDPDHIFEHLEDTAAVIEAIEEAPFKAP